MPNGRATQAPLLSLCRDAAAKPVLVELLGLAVSLGTAEPADARPDFQTARHVETNRRKSGFQSKYYRTYREVGLDPYRRSIRV